MVCSGCKAEPTTRIVSGKNTVSNYVAIEKTVVLRLETRAIFSVLRPALRGQPIGI